MTIKNNPYLSEILVSDHILSDRELRELTGYERPADQIKWLERNGVKYTLRRDGQPRTTCSEYRHALSCASNDCQINLDAIPTTRRYDASHG